MIELRLVALLGNFSGTAHSSKLQDSLALAPASACDLACQHTGLSHKFFRMQIKQLDCEFVGPGSKQPQFPFSPCFTIDVQKRNSAVLLFFLGSWFCCFVWCVWVFLVGLVFFLVLASEYAEFQPLAKMTCAHRTHGVSTRAKKQFPPCLSFAPLCKERGQTFFHLFLEGNLQCLARQHHHLFSVSQHCHGFTRLLSMSRVVEKWWSGVVME